VVTPAKAGVQNLLVFPDSGFRWNDRKERFRTFYEFIKLGSPEFPACKEIRIVAGGQSSEKGGSSWES